MIDPTVENDLRLIALQVESWKKFHGFITYALDKAKPIISVEQERQFTEVRSVLLQESKHVFEELNLEEDLAGKTMNVLQRSTSLRGVRALPADEVRRIELDWNTVFTKLGVAQGQLKARRKELASRTVLGETLGRILRKKVAKR